MAERGLKATPKVQVVIPAKARSQRNQPNKPDQPSKTNYKDRRLIVKVPEEVLKQLNPMEVRDQINRRFQIQEKNDKPTIRTVARSYTGRSLILTTMEDFTASYLLEKADVWKSIIPSSQYSLDDPWTKVVVHSVPTKPFQGEEGRELLRQEIEIFNPTLKLMRSPACRLVID
jgi:hypothetical protein